MIGGVVAITQAAGMIHRCAKLMYKLAAEKGVVQEDVELFAGQLSFFSCMLHHVRKTVQEMETGPESKFLTHIKQKSVLHRLAKRSRIIRRRVRLISKQRTGWMGRLSWYLHKESRDELLLWVDRTVGNLNMILLNFQVETLRNHMAKAEGHKETNDLRYELSVRVFH